MNIFDSGPHMNTGLGSCLDASVGEPVELCSRVCYRVCIPSSQKHIIGMIPGQMSTVAIVVSICISASVHPNRTGDMGRDVSVFDNNQFQKPSQLQKTSLSTVLALPHCRRIGGADKL